MTYEEMFDSWTSRLKAMSAEERRALHHALADFYAPTPTLKEESFQDRIVCAMPRDVRWLIATDRTPHTISVQTNRELSDTERNAVAAVIDHYRFIGVATEFSVANEAWLFRS